MSFRFRKSLKIIPGVRVNFSKTGTSLSVGKKGAMMNLSKKGTRLTAGIPGTGLSYSSLVSNQKTSYKNLVSSERAELKSALDTAFINGDKPAHELLVQRSISEFGIEETKKILLEIAIKNGWEDDVRDHLKKPVLSANAKFVLVLVFAICAIVYYMKP